MRSPARSVGDLAVWFSSAVRIERVDVRDLGLELADELAQVQSDAARADGLPFPDTSGPELLTSLQLGSDSRPRDALLVATDDRPVGFATVELPWRDNTDAAHLRVEVRPDARRQGVGRALWEAAVDVARAAGRTRLRAGAWEGTPGETVLASHGAERTGVGVVRRLDLHASSPETWFRLREEALAHAEAYELLHQVGGTPPDRVAAMVALHEAMNDAPSTDPDEQPDVWDAARLADYENAMRGRRQTLHRVVARHVGSGRLVAHSVVAVNEFSPSYAFQEDTAVTRAHRGHRLGLLMKAEMLVWLGEERPEVAVVDTWNDATNHHMIAINERLGATVVARHQGFRLPL